MLNNLHIALIAIKLNKVKLLIIFNLYVVWNSRPTEVWRPIGSVHLSHIVIIHIEFFCLNLRKTWVYSRGCFVKIAPNNKATLHLWHPLRQCYKKGTPLFKNTTSQNNAQAYHKNVTSQKWQLIKMAPNVTVMAPNSNNTYYCY